MSRTIRTKPHWHKTFDQIFGDSVETNASVERRMRRFDAKVGRDGVLAHPIGTPSPSSKNGHSGMHGELWTPDAKRYAKRAAAKIVRKSWKA